MQNMLRSNSHPMEVELELQYSAFLQLSNLQIKKNSSSYIRSQPPHLLLVVLTLLPLVRVATLGRWALASVWIG